MINEDLRKRMEEAYMSGDKELALKLSQELDVQVVEEQRRVISEAESIHPDKEVSEEAEER